MSTPQPLQQVDRTYVRIRKRKLSYFAGCDYFRLASHPKVLRAVNDGLKKFGLNVAASRMTTGNHELFGKLEKVLSDFFETENATLVSNGYVTNLVAAQALAGEFSHVLMDEKAHPSLKDAAEIFGSPIQIFRHLNAADLQRVVKELGKNSKPILLTDGMFSHDGSVAPLAKYLKILPKNALLLVDDAHGAGTLGKTGKGTVELEDVSRNRVIQTITLSKAFGVYGGAILGTTALREKILARSRLFVGSTPLPLPLANAAIESVKILKAEKRLRSRLNENVSFARSALRKAGFPLAESPCPILAIVPQSAEQAEKIKTRCFENGVFPSFIKYPGGPENGYFRFVISAEHTKTQLKLLVGSLG
jgi:7-keto-8-aminopelargonate synthetase-like enzyme